MWRLCFPLFHAKCTDVCSVVAIHGLNGHPSRTWTMEGSGTFWLKDSGLLPSNLQNSRILTYGYNAVVGSLFGKASSDRILQHAQTLVAELEADRAVSLKDEEIRTKTTQNANSWKMQRNDL